ncbi:hypothetical protein KXD96_14360 [Mycobacterium sp. SMC-2]|uniref:hypothetical protein n=1 Tax=Mycobacterium sp. SMC-2 TaxID=2857058 RepID=UPI0021B3C14E|nr:hypothetical protein [Mycobacterium sp. SMC-2]UXA04233.1 hypothetical protein KXD96_14360 [Mycobacterium sp. SMC-2]
MADAVSDVEEVERNSPGLWLARVRPSLGVLAFTAVTVVTFSIARYRMFTGYGRFNDDEGYFLFAIKSFLDHGWFYNVFTGYGPFYYGFWGGIFSIFGNSVSHDDGRTASMIVWVLSSLLIGVSTWRMTGSIVLGLATQLATFMTLSTLATTPMQAGATIVLLLSAIMAFSCFVRGRTSRLSMALLGCTVMAMMLVKINVGIFALAAMALVCVVTYPACAERRWLRAVVEVGFVVLPLLVTSSKVGEAWVRHYALQVSVAALAVVIALRARSANRRDSKELWWLVGGLLLVLLIAFLAILATGTSPSGLIEMIALPLRFPTVWSVPLALPNWTYVLDLLALVGALGYWYIARVRQTRLTLTWNWLVAALSILVGLFMAFSEIGAVGIGPIVIGSMARSTRLAFVCLAWVALIEPPGKPDEETQFARMLLPPLAVLQALHAFPIAGNQLSFSALLLIPVGALCIANGVRWIAISRADQSKRRAPFAIGTIAVAGAMVVLVSVELMQGLARDRAAYGGSVSLGLPGAQDVRVNPKEAANYRAMVAAIDQNCKSLVTAPEMNSFYLWTRQQPPTGYTPTDWRITFDDAYQQRVVKDLRSIDGVCLLKNEPWLRGLRRYGLPSGPLLSYLDHGFVPIAAFGDYELLKREGSGSRS